MHNKYDKIGLSIFGLAFISRLIFMFLMMSVHDSIGLIDLYDDTIKYISASEYIFGIGNTGEFDIFLVGPGYPFVLGLYNLLISNYWFLIFIQIILSSTSCMYIYKVSSILTRNRYISILAGILSAVSMTSISLANSILTDTLFFFLFVLMLYLFIKGLLENRWSLFVCAGLIGGLAILVRSIAIFYPAILLIVSFLIPLVSKTSRKELIIKTIIVGLIMLLIPSVWAFRNQSKHDSFTVSATGTLAAKIFLSGKVDYTSQNRPQHHFKAFRDSIYNSMVPDIEAGRFRELAEDSKKYSIAMFKKHPGLFIETYLITILDNITLVSSLQHLQTPQLSNIYSFFEKLFTRGFNNTTYPILSLLGLIILIRRDARIALILLINILYFAALSGVTFGQGSRIFFPSQSTDVIFWAAGILFLFDLLLTGIKSIRSRP